MFRNTRTGQTASELPAFPAEDERSAKMRLAAAGWVIGGDAYFDDDKKKFTLEKPAADTDDGADEDDGE